MNHEDIESRVLRTPPWVPEPEPDLVGVLARGKRRRVRRGLVGVGVAAVVAAGVVLPLLLLAGLVHGSNPPAPLSRPSVAAGGPTGLVVTRIDHTPGAKHWTFTRTIRDRAVVRQLYDQVTHLKPFSKGVRFCPAAFFVSYQLVFEAGSRTLLTATVNPTGCPSVRLSTGRVVAASGGFLTRLRRALGLALCSFTGLGEAGHPPGCHPAYQR